MQKGDNIFQVIYYLLGSAFATLSITNCF